MRIHSAWAIGAITFTCAAVATTACSGGDGFVDGGPTVRPSLSDDDVLAEQELARRYSSRAWRVDRALETIAISGHEPART